MKCLNTQCNNEYELTYPIGVDLPKICIACGETTLEQDWSRKNLIARNLCTTLGSQGERNRKEMGSEQYEMKLEQMLGKKKYDAVRGKTERPWWREDSDKILTPSQAENMRKELAKDGVIV